jgi:hypothetical protein
VALTSKFIATLFVCAYIALPAVALQDAKTTQNSSASPSTSGNANPATEQVNKGEPPLPKTGRNKESDSTPDPKVDAACRSNEIGGWLLMAFLAFVNWFGLRLFYQKLSNSDWKLADALSEKAVTKTADSVGAVGAVNPAGGTVAPGAINDPPPASSSRLISFVGSFALLSLFLSTSFYVVWALFTCQPLDRLDKVGTFLLYGATLFAPYAANKMSELLKLGK